MVAEERKRIPKENNGDQQSSKVDNKGDQQESNTDQQGSKADQQSSESDQDIPKAIPFNKASGIKLGNDFDLLDDGEDFETEEDLGNKVAYENATPPTPNPPTPPTPPNPLFDSSLVAEWEAFEEDVRKIDLDDYGSTLPLFNNPRLENKETVSGANTYVEYLTHLAKEIRECIDTDEDFIGNYLVVAPNGFHSLAFGTYMLSKAYEFTKETKDKWLKDHKLAKVMTTLDIKFLKEHITDESDEIYAGLKLAEIYNSPMLCLILCGDIDTDSEIINEIYAYRQTRCGYKLWSMILITDLNSAFYLSHTVYGEMWSDKVENYRPDRNYKSLPKEIAFRFRKISVFIKAISRETVIKNPDAKSKEMIELIHDLF